MTATAQQAGDGLRLLKRRAEESSAGAEPLPLCEVQAVLEIAIDALDAHCGALARLKKDVQLLEASNDAKLEMWRSAEAKATSLQAARSRVLEIVKAWEACSNDEDGYVARASLERVKEALE